ncbi:T9SS type A sorting domain-containing protein [Nostoc ellipsosporum NOK]|nr:T9SS type A sorting domain-containing protein [Nostoc ellipsosporum NOK]
MKKLYTILMGVLLGGAVNAQTFQPIPITSPQSDVKKCATAEVLENMRRANPLAETDQQFEGWLQQKIRERSLQGARVQAIVTIPVIFHIVHNNQSVGTGANISAAAINQQIMQLNKDFGNQNNSPYAVAADMEIRFALATTDPSGNILTEPGIDRVNAATAGFGLPPYTVGYANAANNALTNTVKPATIWDANRYLNIWVLDMEAGILGIATFPASSTLSGLNNSETASTAGVAVGPATVGSEYVPTGGCSAAYGKGRTLTHELGHFFGLRHIWGDATCGTDYCGDTPTHQTDNAGVPRHPKPNSCGTADEMFENYMDYCDDVVLNTFTADQKTRMQTVLINSPRRGSLTTSTVVAIDATASNRIQFNNCLNVSTIAETGNAGTYPRYRDTTFAIIVENKATGAATVTINTGGTAVSGYHYQLLTPSVTFATGEVKKLVTVRFFDNAEIDGNRTLTLSYSISGTGVQAGTSFQTQTITITDDDNVTPSQNPIVLLSQDFETSTAGWDLLTSAGMPNLWVVSDGGTAGGTGSCAYISNSTTAPYANSYTKTVSGLALLRSPVINTTGYTGLQLSFKYRVRGEVISSTAYDYGMATYLPAATPTTYTRITGTPIYAGTTSAVSGTTTITLTDAAMLNNSFHLGFLWNNNASGGNDPAMNIDDILLTASATTIETAVGNSYGTDVRSGTNNIFRSTAGRVIASFNNLNAGVNNVTASVTQSGTALVTLATTVGSYQRSSKVIRIAPASANTTATYQVTLYFTTAELADWGTNAPNLKLMKVKDGVDLSTAIQGSDAQLVTPTFTDYRSTRGYASYTANFTGGFSQFILVSANVVLPVDLISFEARARRSDIQLNWATAQETNNRGFGIERSADGNNFVRIGWVDGHGTTTARSNYQYTDTEVESGVLYYYRLRQTDLDNREKLSEIRTARIDQSNVLVSLRPNPASGKVYLTVSGSSLKADVRLVNSLGQVVRQWNGLATSGNRTELDISGLASGLYHLEVRTGEQEHREKLLIR